MSAHAQMSRPQADPIPPRDAVPGGADDRRWEAVRTRDRSVRGFYYGVLTTGIYCLPGCPSRTPRRAHVIFLDSLAAARAAGLRPCLRCRPDSAGVPAWFEAACRSLLQPGASIAAVASSLGISRATLHRGFREILGVTPSAFRASASAERLRDALADAPSVLDACFAAGFGSASAAYAGSRAHLGASPGAMKAGGRHMHIEYACGESSLGAVVAAQTSDGVCLVEFVDPDRTPVDMVRDRFPRAEIAAADGLARVRLENAIAAVDLPEAAESLPFDVRGTAFQMQVWEALRSIRSGEALSYGELAERVERPGAARAVARAVASNPLAVLVPCHRVVGSDGSLTGYRWGVERKRRLLERERGAESEE